MTKKILFFCEKVLDKEVKVVYNHQGVKKNTLQVVIFMVEFVEEIVELSLLFDFYGEMLDEHKKKIFEDYV